MNFDVFFFLKLYISILFKRLNFQNRLTVFLRLFTMRGVSMRGLTRIFCGIREHNYGIHARETTDLKLEPLFKKNQPRKCRTIRRIDADDCRYSWNSRNLRMRRTRPRNAAQSSPATELG